MKNFHPLGQVEEHGQMIFKSWKLSFKGGKINGDWDSIQEALDNALLSGQPSPRYRITEETMYYDGSVVNWVYDNALIYGLKVDDKSAEDQVDLEFTGWAPKRVRG